MDGNKAGHDRDVGEAIKRLSAVYRAFTEEAFIEALAWMLPDRVQKEIGEMWFDKHYISDNREE